MATIYFDPAAPGGGDGSMGSPYNSQATAVAAMSGGDTLEVSGGVLSAPFSGFPSGTDGAETWIKGDPGNRFIIDGGSSIGVMTQCVEADEQYVGANWASIYKITVNNNLFPGSDPRNANLCENGAQLTLANERAETTDTFFLTRPDYFHTADSVTLSGANITGFRLPSVTDNYTKAQLDNARCYFVAAPNIAANSGVTFNEASKTIGISGAWVYENSAVKDDFALVNLLPAMMAGGWGYRDLGNGTSTLYVWPASSASISAQAITYSSASIGLDLEGVSHIKATDFVVRQISCTSKTAHAPIIGSSGQNVEISDFEVRACAATDDCSGVLMQGVDDFHAHDFKISRLQGFYGMFLQGSGAGRADWPRLRMTASVSLPGGATITGASSGQTATVVFTSGSDIYLTAAASDLPFQVGETVTASGYSGTVADISQMDNEGDASLVDHMLRSHVHDFEIEFVSRAPVRLFTCRDPAIYRGYIHDAALESHGNTMNWYQGCHNYLAWGINGEGCGGYYTWQESDSGVIAFCAASASTAPSGGAKAIEEQQNRFSEHPGNEYGWLGSYVLNTRGVPMPERVTDSRYGNGLNCSSGNAPLNGFTVWNNIHHGSSAESGAALDDWDYNINTKGSGTGSALRGPNDVSADWSGMYTDAEGGDFSYKPGSIARTFTGKDWSSLIAGFKARWPFVPESVFDFDLAGDSINWTNLRAGPAGNMNWDVSTNGGAVVLPPDPVVTRINAGDVTISLVSPA